MLNLEARADRRTSTALLLTQRALSDAFADMSQKNPELREEFTYNAETQKVLARNGDTLIRT